MLGQYPIDEATATRYCYVDTPAGDLLLVGNDKTLHGVYWKTFTRTPTVQSDWVENAQVFTEVISQLTEYFAGDRTTFDIKYTLQGHGLSAASLA